MSSSFDELIHAPKRLQICALLEVTAELEFKVLRDQLNVSDSVLSKHLRVLEQAGYVEPVKRLHNGRQRTWLSLTKTGRKAFTNHVKELKKIVG